MKTISRASTLLAVLCLTAPATTYGQAPTESRSGLFIGYGIEANEISVRPGASSRDNGSVTGQSLVIGYAFNSTWSVLGHVGKADFLTSGGNSTWAGSVGLLARAALKPIASRVTPFVQAGLIDRVLSQDFSANGRTTATFGGQLLPSVGGGAHFEFVPALGVDASLVWSGGRIGAGSGSSWGLTKPLAHLGVVLLPGR